MINLERCADVLKTAGEPTRLRTLFLLSGGDLTVTDLTFILNQSQPRVSRHLKLLIEAGLITRYQEGSWAYFRLSETGDARSIIDGVLRLLDASDLDFERDLTRLEKVRKDRRDQASSYFAKNAKEWDALRKLHAADEDVEELMVSQIGSKRIETMLDLGTGTGRMLELFAPIYGRAIGIDLSRDMLSVARAKLDSAGIAHASVRQGDVLSAPVSRDAFDLVVVHQVLHYLDDPAALIGEASKALRADGRLFIVDFESHNRDALRDLHAHTRLGFSDAQISQWCADAGLEMVESLVVTPKRDAANDSLTVKFWVAKDPRFLMADPIEDYNTQKFARERIA